ncbi:hypothetical protein [Janthinobacterium sp. MDB2-8]|uniref:hypothetical protein n=1 Tax=Janthinobacterium sp. MDB2-8 TaxID=1259338 RepID=UPI003F29807D
MHELSYKSISGVVEDLRISDMHVNYLKNAEKIRKMSGLTLIMQAAAGLPGAVHSAQAAASDGDPVTGFTMNVNGKFINGSFWKVGFKDGDVVQVVGYQKK